MSMQEATTARLDGQRLLALIEDATDPVLITTGDTTIEYASPSFERVLGVKPLLLTGRPLRDFVHPDDRGVISDLIQRTAEHPGHFFHGELRFGRGMGDWRMIAISVRNRMEGESGGAIATCRDVTAQHHLEQQLREAQKFEAIGQLAAGIAHEINTPTQFVSDNVRFLDGASRDLLAALEACQRVLAGLSEGGVPSRDAVKVAADAIRAADPVFLQNEVPAAIRQSLEGLDRIASIARGVRAFSMAGSGEKRHVDLNAEVENTVAVSRNEWKYVSEVVLDLDRGLPAVECVAAEINQVVLNLLINAAHAIEESGNSQATTLGRITVSTRHAVSSAEIRVRDTGTGIPDHVRGRIFDPFFTTKAPGRGTGQGLSIARTIIAEKHGGTIHFESRVGDGTEFVVCLPLTTPGGRGDDAP
jgi:PAS domain S-box-containing protein